MSENELPIEIIVTDDDLMYGTICSIMVAQTRVDCKYLNFKNGREFVDYIKEADSNTIRYLFLDLQMPEMDGWEVLEFLGTMSTEKLEYLNIIVHSSSCNPVDAARAQEYALALKVTYFSKPMTKELLNKIAQRSNLAA